MAGIQVELKLVDGSFTTGMLRAGQSVSSFRKELARVDPNFRKISKSGKGAIVSIRKMDVASRSLMSTWRDISIVTGALVMAFRGIVGAGNGIIGSIIDINAEMERLKFQMLGMSVSAEPMKEAAASVDYLRQKATEAPFSLKELASSFVKLKATGTDPMAGSLQAVVDGIAAFGGTDEQLKRVTLGIVQMSGKSVIQMEEMRQQLGESMPNAMRIMARSMGVSVADLTKAISTGRVKASSALSAFYAELKRTYGGEAQRMMQTFSGQVTQLQANLQILATGDGLKQFFEEQKAGLTEVNDFLRSDEAQKFAKKLGDALTAATRGIRIAVKAVFAMREEIGLAIQVVSGAAAFKMFGALVMRMGTSFTFASMSTKAFTASLASNVSMVRLGVTGLLTMQAAGTSAGLVFVGLRGAVITFGTAVMAAAPWLVAIGFALSIGAEKMGLFGDKTDDAYESLKRYGAESKAQAEKILATKSEQLQKDIEDADRRLQELRNSIREETEATRVGFSEKEGLGNDRLNNYRDELEAVQAEVDAMVEKRRLKAEAEIARLEAKKNKIYDSPVSADQSERLGGLIYQFDNQIAAAKSRLANLDKWADQQFSDRSAPIEEEIARIETRLAELRLEAENATPKRLAETDGYKEELAQLEGELAARVQALKEYDVEKKRILEDATESGKESDLRGYKRELQAKMRVFNEDFRKKQVELDLQNEQNLANAERTGRSKFNIDTEYQEKTLSNREEQSAKILNLLDDEIARNKELYNAAGNDQDARARITRFIDYLNGKRIEAANEARSMGDFGINLVPNIESDETKIKRGAKLLESLSSKVKGLSAELAGAGNAYAKLQFEIARGDYGSIEDGTDAVLAMQDALLEAVAQKEALDKLMKGDKAASRDIEAIRVRNLERQMELKAELANKDMTDAEKFRFRLDSGYYAGLGPIDNIRKSIMDVVGAVDIEAEALEATGKVFREDAFGPRTVDRIKTVAEALNGVLRSTTGIKGALTGMDFAGLQGGSDGFSGRATSYARDGGMLDLIASVESGKAGYNATLDNGRWTGGAQNLTAMTLNEILALQKQMLANPENQAMYGSGNRRGSSALGRYQIVSSTLRGLMKEMGLSGNEMFDGGMQDKMGLRLLARRGTSLKGLRQEWAGLKNVPDAAIQSALGRDTTGPTRARAAGLNNADRPAAPESLPSYSDMIANRQERTSELEALSEDTKIQEIETRLLKERVDRKNYLDNLVAENSGKALEVEGLGKNASAAMKAISLGKLGENTDFSADVYKEIIKAATQLDQTERQIAETRKATRQSTEQLKRLDVDRVELNQRIADQQKLAENPDYKGQSDDLRRLNGDLDKYVDNVGAAYGKTSQQYADAMTVRQGMSGQQRLLDATTRQAEIASETRGLQDGLMNRRQMRDVQLNRDIARIDAWIVEARAAGVTEVDIVRQAEEAKDAIRKKYQKETNPVAAQMEEWRDLQKNLTSATTNWTSSLANGVTGLITGTGDLRGVVNGILSDVVNSQVKFLISSMAGGKAGDAAGKLGSAGKGKFGAGTAHSGGIAGGRLPSTRMSAASFINAPKFHTGGIVGAPRLKKDEVPILAKKKEGIFTEEQMSALAPAGSGSQAFTINAPITVNGSAGSPEQNDDLAKKMAREMEGTMRGVVVDEIRRQQRPGNMMNNRRR